MAVGGTGNFRPRLQTSWGGFRAGRGLFCILGAEAVSASLQNVWLVLMKKK